MWVKSRPDESIRDLQSIQEDHAVILGGVFGDSLWLPFLPLLWAALKEKSCTPS